MSKRRIVAAAKRKGIAFDLLEWSMQTTPGGTVGCWEFGLSEDMEEAIGLADPEFDGWQPDVGNTAEALAWIETLPNLTAATQKDTSR